MKGQQDCCSCSVLSQLKWQGTNNCSSLTSKHKSYMQSEKQEKTFTEMLWTKPLQGESFTPRRKTYTEKQSPQKHDYENYFMFWAALLNRSLDWTSINAYSTKTELGSTSLSTSSLTSLNFRLHISDYRCFTTCWSEAAQMTLEDLINRKAHPLKAEARVKTLLGSHASRPKSQNCLGWKGCLENIVQRHCSSKAS